MKSTKLIISFALGMSLIGISIAQDQPNRPRQHGRPGAMIRAKILKKFDKDGDGKLNDVERAAAKEQFKTNHPDLFAKADTNGDGDISPAERQAAREAIRKHIIEKFDKDGDGKLNEQERKAAWEAFRQRIQEGGDKVAE